jgi:arylsulfatase A-like enzyme
VAVPAPGFHTRHRFDPSPQLLRGDSALVGTHRLEGALLVHAPGVPVGTTSTAQLRDIAPTILNLIGLPVPRQMTGRILDPTRSPIPIPPPARRVAPALELQLTAAGDADQRSVEARLRDLGYMD